MSGVLVWFLLLWENTNQKQLGKEKGVYSAYRLYNASLREAKAGTQGQVLEQRHRNMLLIDLLTLNCSVIFLLKPGRDNLPNYGTAYSRLGHPTPIIS